MEGGFYLIEEFVGGAGASAYMSVKLLATGFWLLAGWRNIATRAKCVPQ